MKRREDRPHILIVGSQTYPDLKQVWDYVFSLPLETIIVTGGAQGVDNRAAAAGRRRGMAVLELTAPWSFDSKKAGMVRNGWLVDLLPPGSQVRAFWDGSSPGTRNTIDRAKRREDLDVRVRRPNDDATDATPSTQTPPHR